MGTLHEVMGTLHEVMGTLHEVMAVYMKVCITFVTTLDTNAPKWGHYGWKTSRCYLHDLNKIDVRKVNM